MNQITYCILNVSYGLVGANHVINQSMNLQQFGGYSLITHPIATWRRHMDIYSNKSCAECVLVPPHHNNPLNRHPCGAASWWLYISTRSSLTHKTFCLPHPHPLNPLPTPSHRPELSITTTGVAGLLADNCCGSFSSSKPVTAYTLTMHRLFHWRHNSQNLPWSYALLLPFHEAFPCLVSPISLLHFSNLSVKFQLSWDAWLRHVLVAKAESSNS